MSRQVYAETFMQTLAGDGVSLNQRLSDMFARILARQLQEDEQGNISERGAFETLSKVFTFVVAPPSDRPASPMLYTRDRVDAARQDAEQAARDAKGSGDCTIKQPQLDIATQTLTGTEGVRDIFVVEIYSDISDAFARFGQTTIQNYSHADGDVILFVDQNQSPLWTEVAMMTNEVEPQAGNARIKFNTFGPDLGISYAEGAIAGQAQYLQIMGAGTDRPFGVGIENITGVNFELATQQNIELAGGLEAYIAAHISGC